MTAPTPMPVATRVKYVKMSGSTATENMRGTMSRMNSAKAAVRAAKARRIRNEVRRVPTARIARWAAAPATAPHAVATIPNRLANRTVPRMIPAV